MIREMNLNDYEDVRILVKQIHELHLSNRQIFIMMVNHFLRNTLKKY